MILVFRDIRDAGWRWQQQAMTSAAGGSSSSAAWRIIIAAAAAMKISSSWQQQAKIMAAAAYISVCGSIIWRGAGGRRNNRIRQYIAAAAAGACARGVSASRMVVASISSRGGAYRYSASINNNNVSIYPSSLSLIKTFWRAFAWRDLPIYLATINRISKIFIIIIDIIMGNAL